MISVIVPVYNVEKYLKRCVNSIMTQTYRELEILLVDDGSSDGSGMVCDMLAKADDRIQVFHKENGGLSSARNYGMQYAHGEYISFVDSDDWIDENFYEVLVASMMENNADVALAGIEFHYTDYSIKCNQSYFLIGDNEDALKKYFGQHPYFLNAVWSRLYKRDIVENMLFPDKKYYEDVEYTLKVFAKLNRFVMNTKTAYHYVVERSDSIMNKHVPEIHLMDALDQYESRNKFLKSNGLHEFAGCNDLMEFKNILFVLKNLYENPEIKVKRTYLKQIRQYTKKINARHNMKFLYRWGMLLSVYCFPRILATIYGRSIQKKRGRTEC